MTGNKDEMEIIREFLRDADSKADINGGAKIWVKQVQEVAYRMEDLIDEYLHFAESSADHKREFITSPQNSICFIRRLIRRHEIANEMEDIKSTIHEISKRSKGYGMSFSTISDQQGSIVSGVAWDDDQLEPLLINALGIEGPKRDLISLLLEGKPSKRTVISLFGMVGLGMTTFANKVFDSQVKRYFKCNA